MILTENIKKIIERKIGADINLLGIKSVEAAVQNGINESGVKSIKEYEKLLRINNGVYNSFIENIIVPKTWFFRNKDSFLYLKDEISNKLRKSKKLFYKILSIPCSTGEEPYSIAATLFEAGLEKKQFHIDAMDISKNAITFAKYGVYSKKHSHIEDVSYSKKYIHVREDTLNVDDILKDQVSFLDANLLDIFMVDKNKYDIIFCRNVFIYFNQRARNSVIANLKKKLKEGGMIFTGHAELNIFINSGFLKVDSKNSFVCKIGKKEDRKIYIGRTVKKKVERSKTNYIGIIKEKPGIVSGKKDKKEARISAFQRIKSLADNGNYQKAMELCESYVEKEVPNAEIYCIKGLIHQLQDNLDIAQKCFEKAIYLNPNYYGALLHMSILLEKIGRFDKSELFKKRAKRSFELIKNYENDFLEYKINE